MTRVLVAVAIPGVVALGFYQVDLHHRREAATLQANILICQLQCHKVGAEYGAPTGTRCECSGDTTDMFERYCEDRAEPANLAR